MKKDLEILLSLYSSELIPDELNKEINYIESIINKYKDNIYEVSKQVINDYISHEVVNYHTTHKSYPPNASETERILIQEAEICFEIEHKYTEFVANKWKEYLTNPDEFNQSNYRLVVHAGGGSLKLPGHPAYRNNEYNNTTDISASLIVSKHCILFGDASIALSLKVDASNFVCASADDCVTSRTEYPNINTLKKINNTYIQAGFMDGLVTASPLTLPQTIIEEKLKQASLGTFCCNEIVLDKQKTEVNGVIFILKDEFQIYDFVCAKKLEEIYGVKLQLINKAKNIPLYLSDVSFIHEIIRQIQLTQKMELQEIIIFCREYLNIASIEESSLRIIDYYLNNIEGSKTNNKV